MYRAYRDEENFLFGEIWGWYWRTELSGDFFDFFHTIDEVEVDLVSR